MIIPDSNKFPIISLSVGDPVFYNSGTEWIFGVVTGVELDLNGSGFSGGKYEASYSIFSSLLGIGIKRGDTEVKSCADYMDTICVDDEDLLQDALDIIDEYKRKA